MKKVITNKTKDVIDVSKCDSNRHYIMQNEAEFSILTRQEYTRGDYVFKILDSTFTIGNCYRGDWKSAKDAIRRQLEVGREVYQFDTMKEAMLFVFGDK